MAKNWAICIGINNYNNMPPLQYAQRDAELMQHYFLNEAGFEKVYLFTDNSPQINDEGKSFNSKPTNGILQRFLRVRFNNKFLSAGDNFWFFYSGHGMRFKDRDYLMPADADPHPDGVDKTAISLYFVIERLRRCGADNVILLLDACRSQEKSKGLGIGEEKQKGVITFFSCSPNEKSYEIEDKRIQQGSFTYALLESLRIQGEGNCATVERLYNRLSHRIPEINHQFRKPRQTPSAIVEPPTKFHLILFEKKANLSDITTLKKDAYQAESEKNIELARQLWIRVNIAASGSDMETTNAIIRLSKSNNNSNLFIAGIIVMGVAISFLKGIPNLLVLEPQNIDKTPNITIQKPTNPDYSTLENLLEEKKWKEADRETYKIMLKVIDSENLKMDNFPCEELSEIDQLWVKHSNGMYGFSVQADIYRSLGGKITEYKPELLNKLGEKVGWQTQNAKHGLQCSYLSFQGAPKKGHLPASGGECRWIGNQWIIRPQTCGL